VKKKIYNINFKKILTIIIIFGITLITLNVTKVFARTLENHETIVEEKSYYNGTIDDDFSDDKIIIVLSKEETNKYKDYTTEDFPEINCKSVKDLTSSSNEILKNKDSKNNEKILINREKFNRILCLELNEKSKEEVLFGIKKLERREEILSAEPNFTFQLTSVPNDEKISEQWGLVNVNAYNSWDISQNANQVIVGVVDTGIDASHSDLTNNIYRLQDHNLNNTLHRDFTTGMEFGTAILEPTDSKGHGTHVAGIIGAQGNNNIGTTGICWNIKLVSLKVANNKGEIDTEAVVKAIYYAGIKAIPILNCSFNTKDTSSLRKVIESYAGLIVCAAGNSGNDIDSKKIYPASYDYDNIITVGAIDSNNNRSKWKNILNLWGLLGNGESNYGEKSVDIYAPGTEILST
jgi:subtilisin family serine protease